MQQAATDPEDYIAPVPEERRAVMRALRDTIRKNLPTGFQESMSYGMIGYVVPRSVYPPGYHCDPALPLPFMSIASQKNFIAIYHMGLYADTELMAWFQAEYPKHSDRKLDMGKSCMRFKKPEHVPLKLIGELCRRMSAKEWVDLYEKTIKR